MNSRLMMSVAAAALIAGTGFADAQGTGMSREAPIAQRTSPSAGAPMKHNDASDSGAAPARTGQSDEKMAPQGDSQSAQQDMKGGKEMNADGGRNTDSKKADTRSQTTGQAGAGAKLSGDQRTRISGVIRGQHVQSMRNVNFSISVGTRVPRDVSFHPLPAEIVTIYPDWRGYEFILVNDQIVVVDPQTFEIVAVIDA